MSAAARGAAGFLFASGQMGWRKRDRQRIRAEENVARIEAEQRLRSAIAVKVIYKRSKLA